MQLYPIACWKGKTYPIRFGGLSERANYDSEFAKNIEYCQTPNRRSGGETRLPVYTGQVAAQMPRKRDQQDRNQRKSQIETSLYLPTILLLHSYSQ